MPSTSSATSPAATLQVITTDSGGGLLRLGGMLDAQHVSAVWKSALSALQRFADVPVLVDATQVQHVDGVASPSWSICCASWRAAGMRRFASRAQRHATGHCSTGFDFRTFARKAYAGHRVCARRRSRGLAAATSTLDALAFVGGIHTHRADRRAALSFRQVRCVMRPGGAARGRRHCRSFR
ncbi:MAG: hypothetical protein KIS79_05170 [Burkholderiales bacterium]|nr:hypothetical protein [Burkholderiales bacterium]